MPYFTIVINVGILRMLGLKSSVMALDLRGVMVK